MSGLSLALRLIARHWWAIPLTIAMICMAMLRAENRVLERQIAALEARVDAARSALARCRSNSEALGAAITRQNQAVAEARRQSEARVAELDRVAEAARRDSRSAEARARQILARRLAGDGCAEARNLILESVR